jgi:hypothetical protein
MLLLELPRHEKISSLQLFSTPHADFLQQALWLKQQSREAKVPSSLVRSEER